ncbi:hypothetical protein [Acetobacter okinawensis]|uniref:Transposase n=1 Tax=Acetobacter okinawensis TaxID=1076594 RepID=A0A252BY12_9PROT|nr:hypothetical protein [Acetobacter okinawensis]OUJ13844.1 hypothetical protein HK26_04180 [Acetobacter okinawensis]
MSEKPTGVFVRLPPAEDDPGYDGAVNLRHLSDAQAQIAALEAEVVRLRGVLSEIAESDDTDNALDPERNKRLAREALKGGAA